MSNIKTFFLTPTDNIRQYLRVYTDSREPCSHSKLGYHNSETLIGDITVKGAETEDREDFEYDPLETIVNFAKDGKIGPFREDDERWPKTCGCGFEFGASDTKTYFPQLLYRRSDTQELVSLCEAPVGAMWYTRYRGHEGPDGRALVVRLVNRHDWIVDARANNCDSPCKHCGVPYHRHRKEACTNPGNPEHAWTKGAYEDSRPQHRCWVRHGDPTTGNVHVDKNGETCHAGAGSISIPGYHGFLHNGYLTDCP